MKIIVILLHLAFFPFVVSADLNVNILFPAPNYCINSMHYTCEQSMPVTCKESSEELLCTMADFNSLFVQFSINVIFEEAMRDLPKLLTQQCYDTSACREQLQCETLDGTC